MTHDRSTGQCSTNYTDALYLTGSYTSPSTHTPINSDPGYAVNDGDNGYWLLKQQLNTYENLYRTGLLTLNLYTPMEYKIWLCAKCTNEF